MKFTFVICGGPERAASRHALALAESLADEGHSLHGVVFLAEGVLHADVQHASFPRWRALAKQHSIALVCCSNASFDYWPPGVNQQIPTLPAPFELGGLAQLVVNSQRCERMLSFGAN